METEQQQRVGKGVRKSYVERHLAEESRINLKKEERNISEGEGHPEKFLIYEDFYASTLAFNGGGEGGGVKKPTVTTIRLFLSYSPSSVQL